jgi:hypothetical protein
MRIEATRTFYSKKLKRVVKKGEVVFGSQKWCDSISSDKLGRILPEKKRRTKRVLSKEIETASIENGEQR